MKIYTCRLCEFARMEQKQHAAEISLIYATAEGQRKANNLLHQIRKDVIESSVAPMKG